MSASNVATTLALLAAIGLAALARAQAPALGERQARLFQVACAQCHVHPGLGVPVVGDEAAWLPRRAQGFDVLLSHTVNGFRDMPPLGSCNSCTEEDFRQLVTFVSGLPEPHPERTGP